MSLCLASAEEIKRVLEGSQSVECTCGLATLDVLRAYVHDHFPGRQVRLFHSHSTLLRNGVATEAENHVLRVGDECPHCAVLTREFLDQSPADCGARLRQWGVAGKLSIERTVVVDVDGVSAV